MSLCTMQVSVSPDDERARAVVTAALGWNFVQKMEGSSTVWEVDVPTDWPEGVALDATLYEGDLEIEVSVEWP